MHADESADTRETRKVIGIEGAASPYLSPDAGFQTFQPPFRLFDTVFDVEFGGSDRSKVSRDEAAA